MCFATQRSPWKELNVSPSIYSIICSSSTLVHADDGGHAAVHQHGAAFAVLFHLAQTVGNKDDADACSFSLPGCGTARRILVGQGRRGSSRIRMLGGSEMALAISISCCLASGKTSTF